MYIYILHAHKIHWDIMCVYTWIYLCIYMYTYIYIYIYIYNEWICATTFRLNWFWPCLQLFLLRTVAWTARKKPPQHQSIWGSEVESVKEFLHVKPCCAADSAWYAGNSTSLARLTIARPRCRRRPCSVAALAFLETRRCSREPVLCGCIWDAVLFSDNSNTMLSRYF